MPDPFTAVPGGAPGAQGGESLEDIFDPVEPAAPAPPRARPAFSRAFPPMNLPGADVRQGGVVRAASPPAPAPVPLPPAPPAARAMGAPTGASRAPAVDDILAGVERSSPVIRTPREGAPVVPSSARTPNAATGSRVPPPEALRSFPTDEERSIAAKQPPMFARKGFIIALLSLLLLAAFGGAAWAVYTLFFSRLPLPPPTTGVFTVQPTPQPAVVATPPAPAVAVSPVPVPAEVELDSDHDGLTDTEEEKYGTNKFATDSDADGLTDRDEVKVFGTQPDNADTDGDSFPDGQEVLNGYNPNGAGKLKEIPAQP